MLQYLLFIILIGLFIFALSAQSQDNKIAKQYPLLSQTESKEEEIELLKFYVCYSSRTAVTWRTYFFSSLILALIIMVALKFIYKVEEKLETFLLLFMLIFLVFISTSNWLSAHVFATPCDRVLNIGDRNYPNLDSIKKIFTPEETHIEE